jgi:ATP-dependent DNA helicase RecG
MHESQTTEFKSSWHDVYLKWISGFANVCFLLGYIDTWGRGTLKIINSCRDAGLPEPEIIEKNGGVSMTLFAQPHPSKVARVR